MDVAFAALRIAVTERTATRRPTRTVPTCRPSERTSRPCGTLATSTSNRSTASTGTTQRAAEKIPAEGPMMNRPGSVA